MRSRQRRAFYLRPLRSKRRRGQALAEFALVIPLFLTLVISICEFSILFATYLSASFTSRDAVQVAAEMGDMPCTDEVVLARIEQDMTPPADRDKIESVEIFWADQSGNVRGGAVNKWERHGLSSCVLPSTSSVLIPYTLIGSSYPLGSRCNIVLAVDCAPGHTTVDTIGVKITYRYRWVTPLPTLIGLSGNGMTIVQTNVMRLEPIK